MEYNLNYELIGIRIKDQRLKMNLTQEVLAEKVGIGARHMSKIETGKGKLSLLCLVSIANVLNTTTDNLLMDNVPGASAPHLIIELQSLLDDCTPEEIFIIVEQAKTFKKSLKIKNLRITE